MPSVTLNRRFTRHAFFKDSGKLFQEHPADLFFHFLITLNLPWLTTGVYFLLITHVWYGLSAVLRLVILTLGSRLRNSPHLGCSQNHTWTHFYSSEWASGPSMTSVGPGNQWHPQRRQLVLWVIIDLLHRFNPWVGKITWRSKWQPTPVFLLGKFHVQRNLTGYSPWHHKRDGHDLAGKQQLGKGSLGLAIIYTFFFKALIHFVLIFVYSLRQWLHSFACSYPVFPIPLIEEIILSPLYILGSFVLINWHT